MMFNWLEVNWYYISEACGGLCLPIHISALQGQGLAGGSSGTVGVIVVFVSLFVCLFVCGLSSLSANNSHCLVCNL